MTRFIILSNCTMLERAKNVTKTTHYYNAQLTTENWGTKTTNKYIPTTNITFLFNKKRRKYFLWCVSLKFKKSLNLSVKKNFVYLPKDFPLGSLWKRKGFDVITCLHYNIFS